MSQDDDMPNYKPDAEYYLIDNNDFHCHQCPKCKSTWQHPKPPLGVLSDPQHECPNPSCDGSTRWKIDLREVTTIDYPWNGEWR